MTMKDLEAKYIKHLDETHFVGYAEEFHFDDEKAFYKGMFEYMKTFEPNDDSDKEALEKITKSGFTMVPLQGELAV
jgi:hypothetical protein